MQKITSFFKARQNKRLAIYEKPWLLISSVIFALFCSGVVVSEIVSSLPPLGTTWVVSLYSSTLNVVIFSPLLYYLLIHPMLLFVREQKNTEIELKRVNNELEHRVDERTGELQGLNAQLTMQAASLERRNQENQILSEMTDFLQTSANQDEFHSIVSQFMEDLFSDDSGAFFVLKNSRNVLEAMSVWGKFEKGAHFTIDECWAMRRGQVHSAVSGVIRCSHIKGDDHYYCVPVTANNEIIGIIHTVFEDNNGKSEKDKVLKYVAERIGVSIANLRLKETLRNSSIRDPLTGLLNRRYMEEIIEKEQARVNRTNKPISVVMIDIDHFKKINDTYGHDAGDTVLRKFAAFLEKSIRGNDIVCRYGGEEFVIIMPEASIESAKRRAEHIRENARLLQIGLHQTIINFTVSLGVATYPEHGQTIEDVMQLADTALYKAKKSGRDRVCVAEASPVVDMELLST